MLVTHKLVVGRGEMFLVLFVQPLGLWQVCDAGPDSWAFLVFLPSLQDSQRLPCISDLIWGSILFPVQEYQTSALCWYVYGVPGPKWISCPSLGADRLCNYPSPLSSGSLSEAYGPDKWAELSACFLVAANRLSGLPACTTKEATVHFHALLLP